MMHRLAPSTEIDLDDIWFYTATESRSADIDDRLIDAFTDKFFLLLAHPHVGRPRDHDLRPGLRSFPVSRYVIIYYRVEGPGCIDTPYHCRRARYRASVVTRSDP